MRAAAALVERNARLLTAVDSVLATEADLVAGAIGLARRQVVERAEVVGFEYFTPLSIPRVVGANTRVVDKLSGDDDHALVFGMLENHQRDVRASRMVFDPQKPGSRERLDVDGLSADQLVVVLNATEARAFGNSDDRHVAVEALFARSGAVAVVVKKGAGGCDVFEPASRGKSPRGTSVGAYPTSRVWPLGSGDTFAAGFAQAWAVDGADPVEAARVGSASAAYWCSTRNSTLPAYLLNGDVAALANAGFMPLDTENTKRARVYLAAPFFNLGEVWLVELVRNALLAQGVEVFSPLHDVGLGDDSVAEADIEGLRTCTSVLALLDGGDFGTVFETGWAEREGIPVVGYASRPDLEGAKMLTGLSGELHDDLSTAVYRAAWRAMGAPAVQRAETATP